ncbi:MAG: signal recognition particle-docking protein FtsY [Anaerolineaceae bacterium]|nr:signal recognition particle-docking protein FtsY [Anaerolineaceae bacterium]
MPDLFSKWKKGLARTRNATFGRIASALGATELSADTWEEMEAILLQADLGVGETSGLIETLKNSANEKGLTHIKDLQDELRLQLLNRLDSPDPIDINQTPYVIMIVGVNGSGKTTTIAKLAHRMVAEHQKTMLVAADTFRAAAVDQLQVWGEKLNLPVIAGQQDADPGSVAYDGIQSALARKMDVVFVDTAGRLHTRFNLMEELKKVQRVISKALPGAPHATWLILDAATGQNAIAQAKAFKESVDVTGIILAKLDTSAKGGMAFTIQRQLGIPILYVGLGETIDSLEPFNREAFVEGILESLPASSGE